MEHVDVALNPEPVDILSASGRQQQQQLELSELDHQHQFSLISASGPELTQLTQAYVGVGQPTGASVNSVESFRISGSTGVYNSASYVCYASGLVA